VALWTVAFEDAPAAVTAAVPLLEDPDPLCRLAVVHLLSLIRLQEVYTVLLPCLDDPDLRVAVCAFQTVTGADPALIPDLFERYERLLARLDDKQPRLESGLWPWFILNCHPAMIADDLIRAMGDRSPRVLLPHLPCMSAYRQVAAATKLAALPTWDAPIREMLLRMAGDRSAYLRNEALKLIASRPVTEEEARPLESLLARKSSDTRRAILTMLLKQPDQVAFASADRLLAARDSLQRLAGLDLLRELATGGREVPRCRQAARAYQAAHPTVSVEEQTLLEVIDATSRPAETTPTLENVLGLIDPADCTSRTWPRPVSVQVDTPAARACLVALDELIEQHRTTPVTFYNMQAADETLLGNLTYIGWPDPKLSAREDQANLGLAELWLQWDRERPASTRDDDGLELQRALLLYTGYIDGTGRAPWWMEGADAAPVVIRPTLPVNEDLVIPLLDAAGRLRHRDLVLAVTGWLDRLSDSLPAGAADLLLDCLETAMARITRRDLETWIASQADERRYSVRDPRYAWGISQLQQHIDQHIARHPDSWSTAHHVRYWQLLHWLDRPMSGMSRRLPDLQIVLRAHQAGVANNADILDHFVAPVIAAQGYYGWALAQDLWKLTARTPHLFMAEYPVLQRLIPQLRDRILDIESVRGELPTSATPLALSLRYAGGLDIFIRLLGALGSSDLVRGSRSSTESRTGTLSHLLRATYPASDDGYDTFTQRIAEARIPAKLLVAAAVYAPQWARYVEHSLKRPSFEEAVWWIHAHTKDTSWTVDGALREAWQAQVAERTPLNGHDLVNGAVDVTWFQRSYQGLGATWWNEIYVAAKYASAGGGHARARLFADAMLGTVNGDELRRRILDKRHQDSVRALGLLPLPTGLTETRTAEVTARYQAIQEFIRTGKQFGAQRRASEESAARIGLDNLARMAGYADPIRLQWAMEAHLVADLRGGSIMVEDGDILVTLSINPRSAEPEIAIRKNGSSIKTLPARLKKNEAIAVLTSRKREIERQISRMRRSLEDAMCRGDHFTADELSDLLRHPVLSRMLRNLVFLKDNANEGQPDLILGYPVPNKTSVSADAAPIPPTVQPVPTPQPQIPAPDPKADQLRTFVYTDAKSDKFWHILLDDDAYVVTYGRTGTAGTQQRKEFADEATARREAAKLIREKTAKGYIETTPPSTPETAKKATNPIAAVIQPVAPVVPSATVESASVVPIPVGGEQRDGQANALQFHSYDGGATSVDYAANNLRLAHPHDLLRSGAWHAWQHDCFAAERIQPFKQVFRELYVVTQNETRLGKEAVSSRYTGQQIQPRQGLALFDRCGWVNSPNEGLRRTFHNAGIMARVDFNGGYFTPAEVEGLTIEHVLFTPRTDWTPIALADVPPRVFSEAMRDLDLVVSVAHRGGVDPEASASTVEMRSTLLQETCALLRLQNVTVKGAHVLIEGVLGSYSVHLGSAVVHRQPGGALCIVPVHSQHRGRLFLPFADDDPRTAEVVSKVVLLARDSEIKDPSILEQIL
jgi:predicted DNA-binding WGR domain protein